MASKGDEINGSERWGFWSDNHAVAGARIVVYEGADGKEVRLTGVSSYQNGGSYSWKDRQPVGRLTKFIREENPREPKPSGKLADRPRRTRSKPTR